MSNFLDTSVLVRYISGDPPEQFPAARDLIDSGQTLYVTDVAIAETAFSLRTFYDIDRENIVDALLAVIGRINIIPFRLEKHIVRQALLLCRPSNRISFADAMIWAAARSDINATVYTFDARFLAVDIDRRRLR